jgi:hypothetical protein
MAVSKRLRYEILRRDNHACRYCGAAAPDAKLTVDHVTPVALGGSDTADNLVTACADCNSGKSSATVDSAVVADVADDALRWAAAMEQAAANLLEQEEPKLEYRAAFLKEWDRWGYGEGDERKTTELPGDWKPSIERFRVAGLPTWVWADIVDTAMGHDKVLACNKFKYCCGIAWNKVTALQQSARQIVAPRADAPPMSPLPAALVAAAIEVWGYEADEGLDPDQEAELRAGVVEALKQDVGAGEIINATRHAAWCGHASIPEGLADIDADARHMGSLLAWEHAWSASCGESPRPRADQIQIFTKECSALAKAGATAEQLHGAATVAGSVLTPHLHFGLELEHVKAADLKRGRQRTVDFWATSVAAMSGRWPSQEEREAVNESIDRVCDDGEFNVHDVWLAAAAAGAYCDADLTTSLTRNLSVFEIAAQPLAGGVR